MSDWNKLLSSEKERKTFCQWFWTDDNGNQLIKELNKESPKRPNGGRDHISRETDNKRPMVYGVLLKHWKIDGANRTIMNISNKDCAFIDGWRFVKIGLTRVSTVEGSSQNRMEKIINGIKKIYRGGEDVAVPLFCLHLDPVDTRGHTEIEKDSRERFGTAVDKKLARKLKLPVTTEWVLTTQAHIKEFKATLKATKKNEANTSLLRSKKFVPSDVEKLPRGLKLKSEKVSLDESTYFNLLHTISFRYKSMYSYKQRLQRPVKRKQDFGDSYYKSFPPGDKKYCQQD